MKLGRAAALAGLVFGLNAVGVTAGDIRQFDQHFNEQYHADQQFGQVFAVFTGIGILIACLGLFGLVSYTIVQRTKEIGIRKVLGASVNTILRLLYKDFARLIVIAFVVAGVWRAPRHGSRHRKDQMGTVESHLRHLGLHQEFR